MNQFTVLVLLLVVFCYCGGKYCPTVLKQNKQILLGVVGGLVLASFFGFRLEAFEADKYVSMGCCDRRGAADCVEYWATGHDVSDINEMNLLIDQKCKGR